MSVPKRAAVNAAHARKTMKNNERDEKNRLREDDTKHEKTNKITSALRSLRAWLRKLDWSDRER
jgi:hypothetical protein